MKQALLLVIYLLTSLPVTIYGQKVSVSNKKEAERVWELAIQAKGGRSKILAVENVFNAEEGYFNWGKGIKRNSSSLSVLPDKLWTWEDNRPSKFGLRMTMYNFALNKQYVVQFEEESKEQAITPIEMNNKHFEGLTFLSYLLMETKWWKPIPEKLTQGKIKSRPVKIVQTRLYSKRIDYAFDDNTILPLKVSYFALDSDGKGEHLSYELYLSDYFEQNGIKVPGTVNSDRQKYIFNVDYNENIFIKPPMPIESAFDAWKIKKISHIL